MILKLPSLSHSLKEFITSSSLVFVANMVGAILGYILVIIVSRELDNIAQWTALNSFVMIIGIFVNGIGTDISKRSAELLKINIKESYKYLIAIKKGLRKLLLGVLVLSPFFTFFIHRLLGIEFLLVFLLFLNIPIQFFYSANNHFLMGTFSYIDFAKNLLLANIVRFIITIFFLFIGFGIYSLPFGIIVSIFIGFINGNRYLKNKIDKKVDSFSNTNIVYTISKEVKSISFTIFANVSMQLPFLILPIIAAAILNSSDADVFAIFFVIGQIINFGITACLTILIPFAANKDDSNIFWYSLFFTIIGSIIGITILVIFKDVVFSVFARAEYAVYIKQSIVYFSSIGLYNVLFFLGRYNIGRGLQKRLFPFSIILVIWILGLLYFSVSELYNFLFWILGLFILLIALLVKKT